MTKPGDPDWGISPDEAIIRDLDAEIARLRAALLDARKFVEGMVKPAAPGVHRISSYHPCHALIDKINTALDEIAPDLSEYDKLRIDAAWERHKRAGEPDWPPRMSAKDLPDHYLCRGSTGQDFEVINGQWVRLR